MTVRAVLASALVVLLGGTALADEEQPEYEVVREYDAFELRRYAPYLAARTEVEEELDDAGNRAFRILADYIFGENRPREEISMTAPVTQQPARGGEKIAMTAPVTQTPADGGAAGGDADASEPGRYVVRFMMPSKYTRETLPEPVDPRVAIEQVPARWIAALRYSGTWSGDRYRRHEAKLLEAVEAAGLEPVGPPVWARYDSPFTLWFLRRNEVWVPVAEPPAGDVGAAPAD